MVLQGLVVFRSMPVVATLPTMVDSFLITLAIADLIFDMMPAFSFGICALAVMVPNAIMADEMSTILFIILWFKMWIFIVGK